ncbi:MAG TPA: hypothetical protein VMS11_07955 [Solirubrobacterales bacterium]|nr:hypothetical protein [Solirubrobacterales bacterium]
MIRDLKLLGLTLLALLALCGVAAQGAAAELIPQSFTSAVEPTELTGSGGVHEWILGGEGPTVLKCSKSTLTGFLATKSADELNLTPSFSGCKIGATSLLFKNNGCKTAFDSDTSDNANTGLAEDGVVSLNCGHSGSLTFETEGEGSDSVTIHFFDTHPAEVPVNQELHGATYSLGGGLEEPKDLSIKAHVFGLKFVCTGKCGRFGLEIGTGEGGTTLGTFTVKGYSDAAHTKQVSLGLSSP